MKRVKARKDEIQRPSQEGAEKRLRDEPNCDVYKGQARFEAPHTVAVGDDRLTSDKIFINVGGRASFRRFKASTRSPISTTPP